MTEIRLIDFINFLQFLSRNLIDRQHIAGSFPCAKPGWLVITLDSDFTKTNLSDKVQQSREVFLFVKTKASRSFPAAVPTRTVSSSALGNAFVVTGSLVRAEPGNKGAHCQTRGPHRRNESESRGRVETGRQTRSGAAAALHRIPAVGCPCFPLKLFWLRTWSR